VADANSVKGKAAKKQTISDIMAKKKAVTKEVAIQMDGEIANQIAQLRQLHTSARDADRLSNDTDKAPGIQEQIDELIVKSEKTVVIFKFRSIGRPRYDELVMAHKPTKDQKKEGSDFNPETFPPVLVAESCVDPEISLEQAIVMFGSEDWNGAELRALFFGALEVNTETGDIPLSRTGSDATLSSLLNLGTQQSTGSLTASM